MGCSLGQSLLLALRPRRSMTPSPCWRLRQDHMCPGRPRNPRLGQGSHPRHRVGATLRQAHTVAFRHQCQRMRVASSLTCPRWRDGSTGHTSMLTTPTQTRPRLHSIVSLSPLVASGMVLVRQRDVGQWHASTQLLYSDGTHVRCRRCYERRLYECSRYWVGDA